MKNDTIHRIFGFSAAVVAGAVAAPQADAGLLDVNALVLEGDSVTGVGVVTRIDNLAVNNNGEWLVELDTDNPDTGRDTVMLLNGDVYLREGDAIEPVPATISSFDACNLNANGNNGWNIFLDGTSGTNDDSGVYFKTSL